jgi:hypothetical protein
MNTWSNDSIPIDEVGDLHSINIGGLDADGTAQDKTTYYAISELSEHRKRCCPTGDELSSHTRRSSFQRSVMQRRSEKTHQKTIKALRDAIQGSERRDSLGGKLASARNIRGSAVEGPLLNVARVTKVQAVYRGYRVRKYGTTRPLGVHLKSGGGASLKVTRHRRVPSDFTMSDFDDESLVGDDSYPSLFDSPAWSPRTKFRRNAADSCFHNSVITVSTAAATDPSEGEQQQGSFSSLFSHDATQDRPIRMPFRKGTPPKHNLYHSKPIGMLPKKFPGGGMIDADEDFKSTDCIIACFPDLGNLNLVAHDNQIEMRRPFPDLSLLRQRNARRDTDKGQQSFSSFFALDDVPAKLPERVTSPLTHPSIPNLPSGFLSKDAQSDECK